MNKRAIFILPLLLAFFAISCNKESSYSIQLHNISEGPVRVKVTLDPQFLAPGQNPLKLDKSILQGQKVEVYYNKGVGISLPTKDDTTLKYIIQVYNADTVPINRNLRSLNNYSQTGNEKKRNYIYEAKIIPSDFD